MDSTGAYSPHSSDEDYDDFYLDEDYDDEFYSEENYDDFYSDEDYDEYYSEENYDDFYSDENYDDEFYSEEDYDDSYSDEDDILGEFVPTEPDFDNVEVSDAMSTNVVNLEDQKAEPSSSHNAISDQNEIASSQLSCLPIKNQAETSGERKLPMD